MTLHSPQDYAQIVDSYIDGWRKTGWMPECRSNNEPGWSQGGAVITFVLGIYYYNSKNSPIVHKYLTHGTTIELIWTITPALVLIAIAFPSFRLLYLLDLKIKHIKLSQRKYINLK